MTFENHFKLTGNIRFKEVKHFESGSKIFTCQLSNGSKENGYNNYRLKAFKKNVDKLNELADGTNITASGWISQDNWTAKDGTKRSVVVFNVKTFEIEEQTQKPQETQQASDEEIPF